MKGRMRWGTYHIYSDKNDSNASIEEQIKQIQEYKYKHMNVAQEFPPSHEGPNIPGTNFLAKMISTCESIVKLTLGSISWDEENTELREAFQINNTIKELCFFGKDKENFLLSAMEKNKTFAHLEINMTSTLNSQNINSVAEIIKNNPSLSNIEISGSIEPNTSIASIAEAVKNNYFIQAVTLAIINMIPEIKDDLTSIWKHISRNNSAEKDVIKFLEINKEVISETQTFNLTKLKKYTNLNDGINKIDFLNIFQFYGNILLNNWKESYRFDKEIITKLKLNITKNFFKISRVCKQEIKSFNGSSLDGINDDVLTAITKDLPIAIYPGEKAPQKPPTNLKLPPAAVELDARMSEKGYSFDLQHPNILEITTLLTQIYDVNSPADSAMQAADKVMELLGQDLSNAS